MSRPSISTSSEDKDDIKDGKIVADFPIDDTPTPTKILRMADELFPSFGSDLKENPFDVHFRKAAEAVKSGSDSLAASLVANDIPSEESLNTPSIFPTSALTTPTLTVPSRPVNQKHNSVTAASSRLFKAIAPHPVLPALGAQSGLPVSPQSNAQVLLKMPTGETFKLYNLPLVKETDGVSVREKLRVTLTKSSSVGLNGPEAHTTTHITPEDQNQDSCKFLSPTKKRELQERNRYAAMRSRIKKRQIISSIEEKQKQLQIENNVLREEIVKLKQLLSSHVDCSVSIQLKQQDTIRSLVGPNILIAASSSNEVSPESRQGPVRYLTMNPGFLQTVPAQECVKASPSISSSLPPAPILIRPMPPAAGRVARSVAENCHYVRIPVTPAGSESEIFNGGDTSGDLMDFRISLSPPQAFPEDLRTARPSTETNRAQKTQKKRSCSASQTGPKTAHNRRLKDKLKELKQKMTQDRETEDFLQTYRHNLADRGEPS